MIDETTNRRDSVEAMTERNRPDGSQTPVLSIDDALAVASWAWYGAPDPVWWDLEKWNGLGLPHEVGTWEVVASVMHPIVNAIVNEPGYHRVRARVPMSNVSNVVFANI